MMGKGVETKKTAVPSPTAHPIFKTALHLPASYRKKGFLYSFAVCKCTHRKGWERMGREAKGKGTEKEKVEKSKKITEDCFSTMRTVQGEKFGELDTS